MLVTSLLICFSNLWFLWNTLRPSAHTIKTVIAPGITQRVGSRSASTIPLLVDLRNASEVNCTNLVNRFDLYHDVFLISRMSRLFRRGSNTGCRRHDSTRWNGSLRPIHERCVSSRRWFKVWPICGTTKPNYRRLLPTRIQPDCTYIQKPHCFYHPIRLKFWQPSRVSLRCPQYWCIDVQNVRFTGCVSQWRPNWTVDRTC